jgi:hypothetical protein
MIQLRQAEDMVTSLTPEMKPSFVYRANTQAHNFLKAFAPSPGLVG